jgi:hypothetical protein
MLCDKYPNRRDGRGFDDPYCEAQEGKPKRAAKRGTDKQESNEHQTSMIPTRWSLQVYSKGKGRGWSRYTDLLAMATVNEQCESSGTVASRQS